jgi:hypothetical protein
LAIHREREEESTTLTSSVVIGAIDMTNIMRRLGLGAFLVVASAVVATTASGQDGAKEPLGRADAPDTKDASRKRAGLRILDPVVCTDIKGYEDYEELPNAELTSDEKLLVYYRPEGYRIVERDDKFVAHFTQVGQVRPLGQKKVLLRKSKLLDYEAKSDVPPELIYIRNTFSLKGLPPGEYEYDVILKDVNAEDSTVTESVKFRIVAAKLPEPEPGTRPQRKARSRGRS